MTPANIKIESFATAVHGFKPITIVLQLSILDVYMSPSYTEISLSSKTRMNTKSRKTVTDGRLTPVEKMEIFILIINI